jgi:ribonuclease-3
VTEPEANDAGGDGRKPEPDLDDLERVLDHRFRDRSLLETALSHSSYANEQGLESNNERLEFLGDSVVGMVAAQLLYRAHPDWREGELTRALHQLVDRRGLSKLARSFDLGTYIRLGRTELRSDGHAKETILANAMEAVLGAMYLDAGLEPVERLARRSFARALAEGATPVARDPKTRFQEWVMGEFGVFPTYRLVHDSEVEGDDERFTSELLIGDRPVGRGVGRSKRESERAAAAAAYEEREEIEHD